MSRLVIPFGPKLIERSLPVRVTEAVVPALKRLTLPLGGTVGVEILAVPHEFHEGAGIAAGQSGRQVLQHRAGRRSALVEVDVEGLNEPALREAVLDDESGLSEDDRDLVGEPVLVGDRDRGRVGPAPWKMWPRAMLPTGSVAVGSTMTGTTTPLALTVRGLAVDLADVPVAPVDPDGIVVGDARLGEGLLRLEG